ncbi:MAG: hypothetical protein JWL70_2180 [Acidimicrobiia bacterium]|nr:hypothetical protein [Acidimicrobiia bacterium]
MSRPAAHRRTITYDSSFEGDELTMHAHLVDERPWDNEGAGYVLHDLELTAVVRRSDLVIQAVSVQMNAFPQSECPDIAPAFESLVGLSVSRGYTKAVQERVGSTAGCAHLDQLARGLGPAAIQASISARKQEMIEQGIKPGVDSLTISNTCHVWADGGPAQRKLELGGWTASTPRPIPRLEVFERDR